MVDQTFNARRSQFRRLGLTPNECKFARARSAGWNDVVRGEGYRDAYDTKYSRLQQMAYERGRQQASLAKGVTIAAAVALGDKPKPLTIWKKTETLPVVLRRSVSEQAARNIEEETREAWTTRPDKRKKP